MTKLLNTYRAVPTASNRTKLQNYINKHMMAVCMASQEEVAFLKANQFAI